MQKYIHTEQDYNEYLASAEFEYDETGSKQPITFARRAIDISRELGVSLDAAEWLIEEHGVFIPESDREIAVMVLEMNLSVEQATKLYQTGFRYEPTDFINPFTSQQDDIPF